MLRGTKDLPKPRIGHVGGVPLVSIAKLPWVALSETLLGTVAALCDQFGCRKRHHTHLHITTSLRTRLVYLGTCADRRTS